MDQDTFYQLIQSKEAPDESLQFQLKNLVGKYPYFQAGIFLYLKCLYHHNNPTFNAELKRSIPYISDRKALFYYIFSKEYEKFFKKEEKKELTADRTEVLLNAFFESIDEPFEEQNLIPDSVENLVTSDYLSFLELIETEEPNKKDSLSGVQLKHQEIIDRFIHTTKDKKAVNIEIDKEELKTVQEPTIEEEGVGEDLKEDLFFTETLAKIYIKQHKYERAYEIIERLSLNYPEKNIYFANQISFLEKLIVNQRAKNKK